MKNPKILEFMSRRWIFLFLIMLSTSKSEDQTGEAGLLCISDCETCPVICAPPPPPVNSKLLPSPPPQPSPQPQVHHHSPPPFLLPAAAPPPLPTRPPPPAYTSWDKSPPPPPPPKIIYIPGNQPPSVGIGPKNYTYPYYYFYSSKAASIPHQGSILLFISSFVLLLR